MRRSRVRISVGPFYLFVIFETFESLEYIYKYVLVGPWFIDIQGLVQFNFNPFQLGLLQFTGEHCSTNFFSEIERFPSWDGSMETILGYFEQAVGEVPSCMLFPEFDDKLSLLTDNDVTVRYFFKNDSELSFELIQLRDWLIAIGCPMSLVYRITRFFYYDFNPIGDQESYQYELRRRYLTSYQN